MVPTPARDWYADLLRVPYREGGRCPTTGLDCLGLAWECLRRLHGDAALDGLADWACDESASVATYVAAQRSRWELLGTNRVPTTARAGDVVLQLVPTTNPHAPRPHVSVVVWSEPRVLLTSTHRHGVVAVPGRSIAHVVATYRLRK
jgi:hypothetical protein